MGPTHPRAPCRPQPRASYLQTEASEQWDYVLVADRRTQGNPRQACQQRRFLEELRTKGFHCKVCWLSAWLGVGHRGQVCPGGPETRLGPRA